MLKVFAFLMTMIFAHNAQAQGFVGGDQFDIVSLQGNVNVVCFNSNGQSSAFYFCRGDVVTPGPFQAFTHPQAPMADEVLITAQRADGSIRDQSRRFDASSGRSNSFNLLVRTLFQRPLLLEGTNILDYELKNRGVVVDFGRFDVEVTRDLEVRTCQSRTIFSSDHSFCQSQLQACDRYFSEVASSCQ
jgi:hypothetical protein